MNSKELLIAIKSTTVESFKDRTTECYNTWGKEFTKLGIDIVFLEENPTQQENYYFKNNILYSKAPLGKEGVFYKHLYYPFQWFIQETSYEFLIIVDADTFVHPQRFLTRFKYWKTTYPKIECISSALPVKNWDFLTPHVQIIDSGKYWPTGAIYTIKRSLVDRFIKEFDLKKDEIFPIWDDYTLGLFLAKNNIPLLHDSTIAFFSPFNQAEIVDLTSGVPFIGDKEGNHLIAQHYLTGKMEGISKNLLK